MIPKFNFATENLYTTFDEKILRQRVAQIEFKTIENH